MTEGIRILAGGLLAREKALFILSNNIANINTPGYKRDIPFFQNYILKKITEKEFMEIKPLLDKIAPFNPLIEKAGKKFRIDPDIIRAMIMKESGGNPKAVSRAGAKGLMQLTDPVIKMYGVKDPFDPKENIMAGAKYLRYLLDRYNGDKKLALAAYNAGPTAVDRWGGIPPYRETVHYVMDVERWAKIMKKGRKVRPFVRTVIDMKPGKIEKTGNPLDLAIDGKGFFAIMTPFGLRYTRNGNFTINKDGVITTMTGEPLCSTKYDKIVIPRDAKLIEIDEDGKVYADKNFIAQILVLDFDEVKKEGENLFIALSDAKKPNCRILQGYLEASNVNPLREVTTLITNFRFFEASQTSLSAQDRTLQSLIREAPRLT